MTRQAVHLERFLIINLHLLIITLCCKVYVCILRLDMDPCFTGVIILLSKYNWYAAYETLHSELYSKFFYFSLYKINVGSSK